MQNTAASVLLDNKPRAIRTLVGGALANGVSLTPAVHSVFGLFLIPLSQTFGWTRASIAVVLGMVAICGVLIYPLSGIYADRRDIRPLLLGGNAAFALSLAAMSLLTMNIWLFYALSLAVTISGAIPNSAVLTKLVIEANKGRIGTAVGLSTGLGNGLGAAIMPLVIAQVIASEGWRAAYIAEGLIVVAIGIPALMLVSSGRGKAFSPTAQINLGEASECLRIIDYMRQRSFWLILLPLAMGAGSCLTVLSHVVPILAERGISLRTGAFVVSVIALVMTFWQIVCGMLFDRFGTGWLILPQYLVGVIGILLFAHASATPLLILAGVFLGITGATLFAAIPVLVAACFPSGVMGRIIALMYAGLIAAQGLTPVAFDHAYDIQGTYYYALHIASIMLAIGSFSTIWLPNSVKRSVRAIAIMH